MLGLFILSCFWLHTCLISMVPGFCICLFLCSFYIHLIHLSPTSLSLSSLHSSLITNIYVEHHPSPRSTLHSVDSMPRFLSPNFIIRHVSCSFPTSVPWLHCRWIHLLFVYAVSLISWPSKLVLCHTRASMLTESHTLDQLCASHYLLSGPSSMLCSFSMSSCPSFLGPLVYHSFMPFCSSLTLCTRLFLCST
jgi:hypothetical protein